MENEYFVLSNTEELGFEGNDASLDNGYGSVYSPFQELTELIIILFCGYRNYIMDSPDLMPEAYEDLILPGHMDDACRGYDYEVGSLGSPNSVMPPPQQVRK